MKLHEIFAKYDKLTISKLSEATGVNYALLLKKSKDPIPGVAYDPEAKNFTAMDELFEKRKIDLDKIDWEKLNNDAIAKSNTTIKDVTFEVGQKYYLRYFKANFEIVYMTAEYVCILQEGLTQPKVLSNNTFIACGLKPYEAPAQAEAAPAAETQPETQPEPPKQEPEQTPENSDVHTIIGADGEAMKVNTGRKSRR